MARDQYARDAKLVRERVLPSIEGSDEGEALYRLLLVGETAQARGDGLDYCPRCDLESYEYMHSTACAERNGWPADPTNDPEASVDAGDPTTYLGRHPDDRPTPKEPRHA